MSVRSCFFIILSLFLTVIYSQNISGSNGTASTPAGRVEIYLKYAKKFYNNHQIDSTKYYLKKALNIVNNHHLRTDKAVEIYYLLSKIYYNENQQDSADIMAQKSIEIAREPDNIDILAKSYYVLANVNYNKGNFFEANRVFSKALAYARQIKDSTLMTDILIDKAYSHDVVAEQDSVLQLLEKAAGISRKIHYAKGIGKAEIGLGNIYFGLNDYKNALIHYQAALEAAKKINSALGTGISYKNIADVYLSQEKYYEALKYLQLALDEFEKLRLPAYISAVYNDFALIYAQKNKPGKVSFYLDKSIKLAKQYGTDEDLAVAYNVAGDAYHRSKKYRLSNMYLDSCIQVARKINYGLMLQKTYKLYSENLYALNDYKKAFDYFKKFNRIKDSISKKEFQDKLAQFQAKYENLKKEAEIERLKSRELINKANNHILWISLIALAIISLLIVFKIQSKRKKERKIQQQQLIIKQKEEELLKNKLKKAELEEQHLKQELDFKTKQLTTHTLNMMQKNRLLQDLTRIITEKSKNLPATHKNDLNQIKKNLERDNQK